jgi:DNA-binding MarR family transcriptional regulator
MDFATLRDIVQVSESVLSKHVKLLEEAGYVQVAKRTSLSRVRTWLSLTRAGRDALEAHLAALRALIASAEAPKQDADANPAKAKPAMNAG